MKTKRVTTLECVCGSIRARTCACGYDFLFSCPTLLGDANKVDKLLNVIVLQPLKTVQRNLHIL